MSCEYKQTLLSNQSNEHSSRQRPQSSINSSTEFISASSSPPNQIQQNQTNKEEEEEEETKKQNRNSKVMVGGFRRNLSFPVPNRSSAKRLAYKIRSASLPVRFHPIVSNLDDYVASLRSWSSSTSSSTWLSTSSSAQSTPATSSTSATWLSTGATLISLVLTSLSDLLNHPQAADPLRNSAITDSFLDDLMRLADTQESFRIALINLLHLQAETRAGLRRKDPTRLASAVRAQSLACKEISRLAIVARNSARTRPPPPETEVPLSPDKTGVATIPVAVCEAGLAVGEALGEVMLGIVRLSEEAVAPVAPVLEAGAPVKLMRVWWVADLVRWKGRARRRAMERGKKEDGGMEREEMERKVAMERLDVLEGCVKEMEVKCERVFRGLVNGRVLLLNILTPSI
ncbi:hypothetical protein LUZ60_016728 [Juncus effusus]|nr:hypothetical protein LUZ60_016728 [Juncus effusus]